MPGSGRGRGRGLLGLVAAALLIGAGCAGEREESSLVVYAASSLREAFQALEMEFHKTHPGVTVAVNVAGSQELRTQIEHGARADVFASADRRPMDALREARLVGGPVLFAGNDLVIVVPRGNPAGIASLADLPRAGRLVLADPEVPIGAYTRTVLDRAAGSLGSDFRARVEARVASRELNVRQVLAKVALGEVDAGIVYRTDARTAADRVEVIHIPADVNVVAEYVAAPLTEAPHPAAARAWMDLLVSPEGQAVLARSGFRPLP